MLRRVGDAHVCAVRHWYLRSDGPWKRTRNVGQNTKRHAEQRKIASWVPVYWHVIGSTENKTTTMGNLLYIIAVLLVIGWLLGVFAYQATGLIHLLLVIALVAVILRIIRGSGAKG